MGQYEEEVEYLYFALEPAIREKIEEGLKDIREGNVISIESLIAQRKTKVFELPDFNAGTPQGKFISFVTTHPTLG